MLTITVNTDKFTSFLCSAADEVEAGERAQEPADPAHDNIHQQPQQQQQAAEGKKAAEQAADGKAKPVQAAQQQQQQEQDAAEEGAAAAKAADLDKSDPKEAVDQVGERPNVKLLRPTAYKQDYCVVYDYWTPSAQHNASVTYVTQATISFVHKLEDLVSLYVEEFQNFCFKSHEKRFLKCLILKH